MTGETTLRNNCVGNPALPARLEPWMHEFLTSDRIVQLVTKYDSPLNVICPSPMSRNIAEIQSEMETRGVRSKIFFARKANKCLSFVDEAIRCEAGVDTASENELRQCLQRGVRPDDIICTAAVKSDDLIDCCISNQVCIAIDNRDELDAVVDRCRAVGKRTPIAIRLGGFLHDDSLHRLPADDEQQSHADNLPQATKLPTRFGFDAATDTGIIEQLSQLPVEVRGVHFHLDGYDAGQRVSGINQSLRWIERLRSAGHRPSFLDIGGGFPISYLDDGEQWETFWHQHERALLGRREPVTYHNHGLGLMEHQGHILGRRNSYPYHQSPVRGDWMANILDSVIEGNTIAELLRQARIELRCEPGRSLLDGCGMTISRVEFRKQNADGDWLIGLSMNRTQCRTSSDDFLVDPILLRTNRSADDPKSGFLVGAYCTESELISLRKLSFPQGVARGDLVVFPNTAGYLMHFLESRSHQFPLAKNLVVSETLSAMKLDEIDRRDD
ncbi:MAG: Y4yA family PLP-dependent enzyme [Phycisphaera sp. RhM]|nr:Y4yA family PLP-dependent enzyme [Phycisphaera sp. RhM]